MKKYIHIAKCMKPTLTEEASEAIAEEYSRLRSQDTVDTDIARVCIISVRNLFGFANKCTYPPVTAVSLRTFILTLCPGHHAICGMLSPLSLTMLSAVCSHHYRSPCYLRYALTIIGHHAICSMLSPLSLTMLSAVCSHHYRSPYYLQYALTIICIPPLLIYN
jgi:hypothetical protein